MKFTSKIIGKRFISQEVLVLRMEKGDFQFESGQYLVASIPGDKEAREYSIYSGTGEPFLEILIKTIPYGSFSMKLSELNINDEVLIDGPYGFFVPKEEEIQSMKQVLIATGTGISPFHSYVKSYPEMDYLLLHGIADTSEFMDADDYQNAALKYCISQEESTHFKGRVTTYLQKNEIDPEAIYHLCGNSAMIHDVSDILEEKGIAPHNIRTEAFF